MLTFVTDMQLPNGTNKLCKPVVIKFNQIFEVFAKEDTEMSNETICKAVTQVSDSVRVLSTDSGLHQLKLGILRQTFLPHNLCILRSVFYTCASKCHTLHI